MKKLLVVVLSSFGILLSILIVIVLAMLLFNRAILSSNAPGIIRLMVRVFAPPKDLYDHLIKEELDISKKGLIKRFEYKNKYAGRHHVGVLLDRFTPHEYSVPLSQRYQLKLKMEVNFFVQNSLILSRVVADEYSPFLGGPKGNGFSFFIYECPKDLPVNKLITCEVKVIEPDNTLNTFYGPVRFFINKYSDK